jgi:hypothetical protein
MNKLFGLTVALGSSLAIAQTLAPSTRALTAAEVQTTLTALCEGKMDVAKRTCFPKKGFYSQIERSEKSQLEVIATGIQGAFSKASSKQVIASAFFKDADGFEERFVGGVSVILENNKVVRQIQDGGSSLCQPFARGDGRDLLVCKTEAMGQGNLETSVYWNDIGTGAKTQNLVYLVDNTAGGCGNPAKTFGLGKYERKDMNNDKKFDLVVPLEFKTAPNPNCDVDWAKVAAQKFSLVFLWDGKAFKADAATAKLIAEKGWKL